MEVGALVRRRQRAVAALAVTWWAAVAFLVVLALSAAGCDQVTIVPGADPDAGAELRGPADVRQVSSPDGAANATTDGLNARAERGNRATVGASIRLKRFALSLPEAGRW